MMRSKTLVIYPEKCNGCGDCEAACSLKQAGINNREGSCIRVMRESGDDTFFLPMTCQQCDDPPCLAACPNDAISRDEELDRVLVNHQKCVGCRMCVSACPFGAMGFDEERGKSSKCDLCGGAPECVRVCITGALVYDAPHMLHRPQMVQSAAKIACVMRSMVF